MNRFLRLSTIAFFGLVCSTSGAQPLVGLKKNGDVTVRYFETAESKMDRPERPLHPLDESQLAARKLVGKGFVTAGIRKDGQIAWIQAEANGKVAWRSDYTYADSGQVVEGRRVTDLGNVTVFEFDQSGRWKGQKVYDKDGKPKE